MTGSIEKRGKNSYRLVDGNIPTFAQYVEIWTKDYALKELAPSTYYRYKRMLETRITPYFGHYKLNKIKPTDIMRFYDLLEEDTQIIRRKNNNGKKTRKPLSQKTILEHHRLLSAMLHRAVYWQLIVSNPAERVQPPKTSKPLRRHYDEDQTKILVDNLQKLKGNQIKYRTAILLDIFTGARLGELVGLEWSDIDLKNGIININKSSQYLSEKGVFTKAPKTESSIRDVATVSARLGHAQITTTYNFYVHPLKSHDRTAGNVLENLLISSKAN